MATKKINYIEIFLHLVFWSIPLIVIPNIGNDFYVGQLSTQDNSLFYSSIYSTVIHAAIFYSCVFFILKRHKKSQKRTFLLCCTSFIVFTLIESVIDFMASKYIFFPNEKIIAFYNTFILNIVFDMIFIIIAYTYGTIRIKVKIEKNEQKLEVEKLKAELNFLRMQTNPHFLFNTLNNLYGLARKEKAMATSEGITKLSKMMRYITYNSTNDYVQLDKEIENIQIYIELQKLRFSTEDDISITFETEGDFSTKKIAPMLLITLVENAFKHGIDIDKKSFIHIRISLIKNELRFIIKNTIHKKLNQDIDEYSGVGLLNLRKRLEILTFGKYNLDFKEENNNFTTSLVLKL